MSSSASGNVEIRVYMCFEFFQSVSKHSLFSCVFPISYFTFSEHVLPLPFFSLTPLRFLFEVHFYFIPFVLYVLILCLLIDFKINFWW